jgi:hypothetical protein
LIEPLETRLCLTAGEIVRNGAFEAGATVDWVKNGAWSIATGSQFHGGAYYAYFTDANGNPGDNLSGSMYQELTVPSTAVNPTLTFWTKITTLETTTTTARDFFTATIQKADGTRQVLQSLTTLSNLNAVSTSGPATSAGKYTFHSFALSPSLKGQTIRIDFTGSTNASLGTTFRVDDVGLSEPVPVTPGVSKQVVGYLPYYRQSLFSKMDLNLVTWINYFSIQATATGGLSTPNVTDANIATVVNAAHARGVGVSITVGPQSFNTLAADPAARTAFAENIKNYIVARNLDGVDIDWESPATGANQVNYGLLIDELYAKLQPLGKKITAAVNPWTKEIPVAATKLMNWVNVMCYDFDYANHSTYSASIDSMNQWMNYGVAKDKLVMGVPYYGRYGTSWSASSSTTYSGALEEYKTLNGAYPAAGVDSYVNTSGATTYFNGVTTMEKKMAFIRDNSFAGAMIWELGQDHWDASNKYDKYSLQTILSSMLRPPTWLTPASGSLFDMFNKEFVLAGGQVTFSGNAANANAGMTITVQTGATATLGAAQHWSGLSIEGTGKLDIKDKAIARDYTGASPIGGWNSSVYTGISGMIQSGRNGGAWNGSGIMTSMAAAMAGQTTVGVGEASAVLGITGSQTAMWQGKSVDSTTVLIKYTYAGDANLDGTINADDYAIIDLYSLTPGSSGFNRGDFNYDGSINADDYALIDTIAMQPTPTL